MTITVADLFAWKKKVTLHTPKGDLDLWMRILSVVDEEDRMTHAVAESYQMRVLLDDEESLPYKAHISPLGMQGRDTLITTAVALQTTTFWQEAFNEIIVKEQPQPEDGSLDEKFRVMEQKEQNEQELARMRSDHVKARQDGYREELEFMSDEQLLDTVKALRISEVCLRTYNQASQRFTVWKSCYQDEGCTKPLFASLDEVGQLPGAIFDRLVQEYLSLDVLGRVEDAEKN